MIRINDKYYLIVLSICSLVLMAGCSGGKDTDAQDTLETNVVPTANAGSDENVEVSQLVQLDASSSQDSDGIIIEYQWQQTSGTSVNLINANMANASFTAPATATTLVLQLTVTDNDNANSTDTVIITVINSNIVPEAIAGENQTVETSSSVSLDGSASNDSDGFIESYAWQQTNGETVSLSNAAIAAPNFIAPAIDSLLEFELTVTDDDGLTNTDSVRIVVGNSNIPPNANAGENQTVNVNSLVSLNGSGSSDNDGSIVSYSWAQMAGTNVDLSSNSLAEISFTAVSSAAPMLFELTVTDDDGDTDSDMVEITVINSSSEPGLDGRPNNSLCVAPDSAAGAPADLILVDAFPDLPNSQSPLGLYQMPANDNFFYSIELGGRIIRFDNDPAANSFVEVANLQDKIDNFGSEGGLLGFAFHPNAASNRAVYISYTTGTEANEPSSPNRSVISRFTLSADFSQMDLESEQVVLELPQIVGVHNGGDIHFGSDGHLYIGFGDGGFDSFESQNTLSWYGAMLRIDVDPNTNIQPFYSVPADNPFVGNSDFAPEIFVYGLRNPWRWSVDQSTGDIWVGDVGEDSYEEIDFLSAGGNYGWPVMEASFPANERDNYDLPIVEIDRSLGGGECSITGGYVYRGTEVPGLNGTYLFSDWCTGAIYSVVDDGNGANTINILGNSPVGLAAMGQANNGEIYGLTDRFLKIEQGNDDGGASEIPALLSETNCFNPTDPSQALEAMIPFNAISPLWSDGADKQRFLAIPNGTEINIDNQGDFEFPVGSILAKHFTNNGTFIETRLLMRHQDAWAGYSYEWNETQDDAVLLEGAKDVTVAGLNWHFPSQGECRSCHTALEKFTLAPELRQLNHDYLYQQTERTANQMDTLESIGMFTAPPDAAITNQTMYALDDTNVSAELRAKSYLHSNCAHCHQPNGLRMDFRFETPLADMDICDVEPSDNLGITNARLFAPGDVERSIILSRINRTDESRMPPLATNIIDMDAVEVISDWIESVSSCQ